MDADDIQESSQMNPLKRSFVEALRGFQNSQPVLTFTPDPKRRNVELPTVDIIKIEVSKVLLTLINCHHNCTF